MHHGILCGMAAFKEHCIFGFWKASLVLGGDHENPMSQFGHLTSLSELPPKKALAAYVKKAARLNEEGVKLPRPAKTAKEARGTEGFRRGARAQRGGAAGVREIPAEPQA